jgi:hypothetical protein
MRVWWWWGGGQHRLGAYTLLARQLKGADNAALPLVMRRCRLGPQGRAQGRAKGRAQGS